MTKGLAVGRQNFGFRFWSLLGPLSLVLCHWSLVLGPCHEFSRTHRLLVCRRHTGGDPVLSAQAQAPGAPGLQHPALAEIPRRNTGQRPLPTTTPQLAARPPTADARARHP